MGVLTKAIEEFEKITGYPLQDHLQNYVDFSEGAQAQVVDYYGGLVNRPHMPSFNALRDLLEASAKLNEVVNSFRDKFDRVDFWLLMDLIEELRGSLWSIDNSSRWQKSAITKSGFGSTQQVDHTLQNFQTIEHVALNIAGSDDQHNDWVKLAIDNDLREEDYTPNGGTVLSLTTTDSGLTINSVVDNLVGENILGKDVDRQLSFSNNDLTTLTPKKTLEQSVEINSQLRQGDNPEFPGDGIQAALLVGSNLATFQYQQLIDQLTTTFQKDDTMKSIQVLEIASKQDALFVKFQVESRLGDLLEGTASI
jgi:hypothetical protein